ncbi:MAG TPA: hypothetical protein VLC11_03950, partial [Gemmatimonadales bacterium]|nr:hypothetical protein [Gemmatimonadales bacterium]
MRQLSPAFRRSAGPLLALCLAGACGQWQRVGDTTPRTTPAQTLTDILDQTAVFRRMGRLTSATGIPFVGVVDILPGPADTGVGVVALSLENRYFSFERRGAGFEARYRVDIALQRAGLPPIIIGREQSLRVGSFPETLRNEESVVFQEPLRLAAGTYHLIVTLTDRRNNNQG